MEHDQTELKVGDRVREIYNREEGIVIRVWDGKHFVDYYEGEQYNPWRITVRFDNSTEGVLGNGTVMSKAEYLEKI